MSQKGFKKFKKNIHDFDRKSKSKKTPQEIKKHWRELLDSELSNEQQE